ncbi:disease resistance protein-like protein [Tanacetum coccineum]
MLHKFMSLAKVLEEVRPRCIVHLINIQLNGNKNVEVSNGHEFIREQDSGWSTSNSHDDEVGGHKPIEDNVQNLEVKNVELQPRIETESAQVRNDELWDTKDICLTRNKYAEASNSKSLWKYSISKLKGLVKFIIRDCDLLKELPPEIGELENLKAQKKRADSSSKRVIENDIIEGNQHSR